MQDEERYADFTLDTDKDGSYYMVWVGCCQAWPVCAYMGWHRCAKCGQKPTKDGLRAILEARTDD